MPMVTDCHVPGCTFNGNHGFDISLGGMLYAYHSAVDGTHVWYKDTLPNGQEFISTSQSEVFERCIVPRSLSAPYYRNNTPIWIEAWRARLAGHPRKAKALFKKWSETAP